MNFAPKNFSFIVTHVLCNKLNRRSKYTIELVKYLYSVGIYVYFLAYEKN